MDELAITHTAKVFEDVDADIIAVVEAESQIALKHFTDAGVAPVRVDPPTRTSCFDGNDDRGIDVGLMTKPTHSILAVHPHVDDRDAAGRLVFGRDCPEYTVQLASGTRIVVLVNHFKSEGHGRQSDNDAKRHQQATRVVEIYDALRTRGEENVVCPQGSQRHPAQRSTEPLLQNTDLRDIATHPTFSSDGRPGTYANGTASRKIDYVLLSPALYSRATGGAIFRKDVWGGKNGALFPHYPTMTSSVHAGSDHAAIYADVELD